MADGFIVNKRPLMRATRVRPAPGIGFLAGSFPDGITSVEGQPSPATIRVLYRAASGDPGDGALVAEVMSNPDGTWLVAGLDHRLKFDVICRHEGYNDMILSNVSPALATGLEFAGSFTSLDDQVEILLGAGPYKVDVVDGTPPLGVTFRVEGNFIVATGSPGNWGQFTFTLRVIDSDGLSGVFVNEMVVAEPLPEVIGEPFGGGIYIGNITIADGGEDDGEYSVIMAGSEGQVAAAWRSPRVATPGTQHLSNGVENTRTLAGIPTAYAAQHCINYRGDGFDDWYLPARGEIWLAWVNRTHLAGLDLTPLPYWSSTSATSSTSAWYIDLGNGSEGTANMANDAMLVRPVRRIKRP